jgi:hypothetical protein
MIACSIGKGGDSREGLVRHDLVPYILNDIEAEATGLLSFAFCLGGKNAETLSLVFQIG